MRQAPKGNRGKPFVGRFAENPGRKRGFRFREASEEARADARASGYRFAGEA